MNSHHKKKKRERVRKEGEKREIERATKADRNEEWGEMA